MSIVIEKSSAPAAGYISLIRKKYGNTRETNRYITDTQKGMLLATENKHKPPVFFHALQNGALIGHIGLIPSDSEDALFGFFELEDEICFQELWYELLIEAKYQKIKKLFGPVNGTVWHPYRVISQSSPEPFFLCEPLSAINYYKLFQSKNPKTILEYYSAYRTNYDSICHRTKPSAIAVADEGILIEREELTPNLLEQVYDLATKVFSINPGFTHLSLEHFNQLYNETANNTQNVIYTASKDGEYIGMSFNITTDNNLIMKTIGVLPQWQEKGVGNAMVNAVHSYASHMKIEKVIYALVRSDNKVRHFPKDDVVQFRKYAAFLYLLS